MYYCTGVWEIPLNAHYVEDFEGGHCPYLDQCVLHNHDADEVFQWLQEDFLRYYDQNRAPYMMPFHTNWFSIKELENGLQKFLDWVITLYVFKLTEIRNIILLNKNLILEMTYGL